MSSHLLGDFRSSPLLYSKKILGQIDEKPNTAFALGSAAHKLILEGRKAFDEEYIVSDGPINPKTGECYGKTTKAYAEWIATQDREVISSEDFGTCAKFHMSVWRHEVAVELLSKGVAEGVVRAELEGVPCQIRMDWFNPEHGLVDLKTCAEVKWFESDARRFGYYYQMAFYRAVIQSRTGVCYPVRFLAVEKCEPYACGVFRLTPALLDEAEMVVRADLRRYKECCVKNCWPTGYEKERIIDKL
jgi:hypothetical protein